MRQYIRAIGHSSGSRIFRTAARPKQLSAAEEFPLTLFQPVEKLQSVTSGPRLSSQESFFFYTKNGFLMRSMRLRNNFPPHHFGPVRIAHWSLLGLQNREL